jgi:hypothetical protein
VAHGNVTDEETAELIQRTAEAAKAYIRGDMRTYFTLIRHGDDYTLMSPFGGEPTRGFDTSPERLEALERYFRNGEAEPEVVQTCAYLLGRRRHVVFVHLHQRWSERLS